MRGSPGARGGQGSGRGFSLGGSRYHAELRSAHFFELLIAEICKGEDLLTMEELPHCNSGAAAHLEKPWQRHDPPAATLQPIRDVLLRRRSHRLRARETEG